MVLHGHELELVQIVPRYSNNMILFIIYETSEIVRNIEIYVIDVIHLKKGTLRTFVVRKIDRLCSTCQKCTSLMLVGP